jgi:hypothetical protein
MESWGTSNRLHASNKRSDSANDALQEYRDSQVADTIIDEIIEETYDGIDPFDSLCEPTERYLDGEHSGRYYHRKSR